MIYLELFIGFLQVGCLAFGGAYAAIPFIREVVLAYGWLDDSSISYIIAISESTPGPIMVNMATYVGQQQGGLLGALCATTAVVTPAFLITIAIMSALRRVLEQSWFRSCLNDGLMPSISGIIIGTGAIFLAQSLSNSTTATALQSINPRYCLLGAILLAGQYLYRRCRQQQLSPIALILVAAVLGVCFL